MGPGSAAHRKGAALRPGHESDNVALALSIRHCERSEAIQNSSAERLWIASSQGLLAMTEQAAPVPASNSHLNRRHTFAPSRRISPELLLHSSSSDERGRREDRVPTGTRGLLREKCTQKTAQQHTGVAEHSAFPAQWSDGLCRDLPGAELSLWPPSPRELTMPSARLGSRTSPQRLDRSNHGQDHTVLPYASAPLVHTWPRTHRDYPPCPHPSCRRCRVHRNPARVSNDSRTAPLRRAGLFRCMPQFRISVKWNIFVRRG
jgi:hypothetical protein